MTAKKSGIDLIAEERQSQIEKHKFTLEHDKEEFEKYGDTLTKAINYLLTGWDGWWPQHWERYWKERLDKKSDIEKLAVIGALAAAKIDLLQSRKESEEVLTK